MVSFPPIEAFQKAATLVTAHRLSLTAPKGYPHRVVVYDKLKLNPARVTWFDQPVTEDSIEVRRERANAAYAWFSRFDHTRAEIG
jgi:hypothetical protein